MNWTQQSMPTSPEAAAVKCPHCTKAYKNKRSLREHLRHHCKQCRTTSPRKYTPSTCKHCSKTFHSANSLRVHASTQHTKEYARSPKSVKEHRAPLGKKQSSKRQAAAQKRADGPHLREPSAQKEQHKSSTDQLLQHYARSGDPRSREIWEGVLRRQHMQNRSTRGQESS